MITKTEEHTAECQSAWDAWAKAARSHRFYDEVIEKAKAVEPVSKQCGCWGTKIMETHKRTRPFKGQEKK